MNFRPLDYIDPARLNLDWIKMKVDEGKEMKEKIDLIIAEIVKADLPTGDYMDLEAVWDILRDEDLSLNDVLEGLVKVTNALLNIRAILNNEE